jgi:hypothetical protein
LKTLNWSEIRLDDISPGMRVEEVLVRKEWFQREGVLCSEHFGNLGVGFPFSNADLLEGKVEAISGKVLTMSGEVLAEVGQSWESLLCTIPIRSGSYKSDEMALGLGAANFNGVVGMLRFYRLRK